MKKFQIVLLLAFLLSACTQRRGPSADYPAYGGNKQNNRFSPLSQINLTNIKELASAWIYNSADTADTTGSRRNEDLMIQCQPIVVGGVLYGTSPTLKLFALQAATGKEVWKFDPFLYAPANFNQCRGLAYWT